jgi:hypothetical protein
LCQYLLAFAILLQASNSGRMLGNSLGLAKQTFASILKVEAKTSNCVCFGGHLSLWLPCYLLCIITLQSFSPTLENKGKRSMCLYIISSQTLLEFLIHPSIHPSIQSVSKYLAFAFCESDTLLNTGNRMGTTSL